jgi:hypothetical protein
MKSQVSVACWTVFTELLPGNALIKFRIELALGIFTGTFFEIPFNNDSRFSGIKRKPRKRFLQLSRHFT